MRRRATSGVPPGPENGSRDGERGARVGRELRRAYREVLAEKPPDAMLELLRRLERTRK